MFRKFCLIFIASKLIVFGQLLAEQTPQESAIQAYDKGDFYEASKIYEGLIESGVVNGHVFYNLGNAYYRLEEPGKAMGSYLAAHRLLPRDPDVKANLAYVHSQIEDKLEFKNDHGLLNIIAFWQDSFTAKEIFEAFLWCWWIGLFLFGIYLWRRELLILRPLGIGFIISSGILFVAFLISFKQETVWGAVSTAKAAIRSGPGEQNTQVFELHQGAPIMINEEAKEWFMISLSDGKKGWVAKKQVTVYRF